MPLVINTNTNSLNAQRLLSQNTMNLSKDLEQLASGYRINHASDDAAGLQISQNLQSQYRGIEQAVRNSQDGLNLLSVAEGTLSVVQDNLQRIRELAVQAANDVNGTSQRTAIKQEIDARIADINRMTKATQFNGVNILQSIKGSFNLEVGANGAASTNTINIASALGSATATGLGLKATTNMIAANSNARAFLGNVDSAIANVSTRRATIGSFQNRLQSAIANLQIADQNFQASASQIRDVNVAAVTADLSRNQILQQASVSILSQANQLPALALKLIG